MRKLVFIVLLFVFLYIGFYLGDSNYKSSFNISQSELDSFEEYIEKNEYNTSYSSVKPNAFNKIGKKAEGYIEKGFELIFDFFK